MKADLGSIIAYLGYLIPYLGHSGIWCMVILGGTIYSLESESVLSAEMFSCWIL